MTCLRLFIEFVYALYFNLTQNQTAEMSYRIIELEVREVSERLSGSNFCLMQTSCVPGQHLLANSSISHIIAHFISESLKLVAFAELKFTSLEL